ncbi:MAG: type I-E CRISPR-associated protein Cse1/CasA [Zoogloea sp.]|uniref:type I-E CRISPR-associated protein Cse1/CasA n=1 Tax=Zoogloea sp. TaxID=49181 RepID=UPI003F2E5A29
MNLINDPWLQLGWRDGREGPGRLVDVVDPDVVALLAPRADFRGAMYQWMLGVLQLAFQLEHEEDWQDMWFIPPDKAQLQARLAPWAEFFELAGDGPRFMQDLAPGDDFGLKDIRDLLIDQGSNSNLHFNKPDTINGLCPCCAAQALYCLQQNAPSGGVGHRVSMRGGGPLTTLLEPQLEAGAQPSLWQRLWLNVLPLDQLLQPGGDLAGLEDQRPARILPWVAPTRTSEKNTGSPTGPVDAHPLQAYWGMPRRIRLAWESARPGTCDLCGAQTETLLTQYRTKNYGVEYQAWEHPLTPYYHDPKNKTLPLSAKGQKGGIGYRHWLGLTLGRSDRQPASARLMDYYLNTRGYGLVQSGAPLEARVWVFGFDCDNMKARSWYDATLPVLHVLPERLAGVQVDVGSLLEVAHEAARQLHTAVKGAWCDRPKDMNDEPAVPQSLWAATENLFYQQLRQLAADDSPATRAAVFKTWLAGIRATALRLFEDWSVGEYEKGWDIKRLVDARQRLERELLFAKPMKQLHTYIKQQEVTT